MEGFLRVDNATNLPGSPTNSFLADEVASICPLITPSPPTNDLINPLLEPTEPDFVIGQELATKLQHVQDSDKADSASSSSSALAEPACAHLLNHRNIYHHMVKDQDTEIQDTTGKTQPLQLTFRNPPDYFFMTWNWPLIRKVFLWIFLSGLVAMVAIVMAMIYTLPKTCNPTTQWYQGNILYEIFPASFYSEKQSIGDFRGISKKAKENYFTNLGIKGVRLNSIFTTQDYPNDFDNITSLINIAPSLGTIKEFKNLVKTLKSRNISLILDLPVHPFISQLPRRNVNDIKNETNILEPTKDLIEQAILHWTSNGVDGFYLKGLEHLVDDPNFAPSLREWKKVLGPDRAIIVSNSVIDNTAKSIINIVLNNVDLVDVKLDVNNATALSMQIGSIQNSTLFSKPGMPWIHWSLGNAKSRRLADILPYGNATLGATLLQLMLPGTPSIFYGDEIGLHEIQDHEREKEDIKHLHQLNMMAWPGQTRDVLPWIYGNTIAPCYEQIQLLSDMAAIREESPSIYMNSVYKEGVNKANAEVKYTREEFLVVQRWYPRRKQYVVVCNLESRQLKADLSTLLYSGKIVVGPRIDSVPGSFSFKNISLWPGESVVIVLD